MHIKTSKSDINHKWNDIFTVAVFWITSDIYIHIMYFTLEPQTPITFLFVNENKCGYAFS